MFIIIVQITCVGKFKNKKPITVNISYQNNYDLTINDFRDVLDIIDHNKNRYVE